MFTEPQNDAAIAEATAIGSGPATPEAACAELDAILDEQLFDAQWDIYDRVFPANEELWQIRFRRLLKRRQVDEAVAMVDERDFGEGVDELAPMVRAEWLFTAHQDERATAIYEDLLIRLPDRREVRLGYAKRLFSNGQLVKARDLIAPVAESLSKGSKAKLLWSNITATLDLLESLEGAAIPEHLDCRILSMKHAILHFSGRKPRKSVTGDLGRLSLVTGSLGPGGAERQLTRLAIELERARKAGGSIGKVKLSRPVEIVVRSHGPEKQNDFYLAEVQAEDVELHQLNLVKPVSHKVIGITDDKLKLLLDYLPPSVNYGVKRLTKHLMDSKTDIVSAWQDGACLFSGLPALLAGVPQIQLAIRGLPPSLRRHMFRPEYEVLYRAMAQVPGVTFVSNNHAAAQAYADWLGIPIDRFAVVYNGVQQMEPAGSDACEQMWREFQMRTADAEQTIGGVFRFDTDKQPNLWIRFAARYLKQHPKTRIVLVGGGRLLEGAKALAEELGIAHRILFTDRSNRVGFWMTKMDVMLLLSRYEGLPNVLIEAQYMGVRVVTTPAGGAAECLIDGVTGHVLECCEKPDLDNIVEKTRDLAAIAHDRSLFAPGGIGREFLDGHFAIPNMLGNFVHCTTGLPAVRNTDKIARQAA